MNIRYYCEHIAFRNLFNQDPMKIVTKILTEKEEYIYNLFLKIYDEKKQAFPYQKKDFKIEKAAKDQLEFLIINLPEQFMEPTLCHKIVLAYSFNLDLYQYFTVEDGNDALFGNYHVLCAWIEGNHVAFRNLEKEDEEDLPEKIYDIMMVN